MYRDVSKMFGIWRATNNSAAWSIGRLFVMWQYNTKHHSAIKQSPYKLVFALWAGASMYVT